MCTEVEEGGEKTETVCGQLRGSVGDRVGEGCEQDVVRT